MSVNEELLNTGILARRIHTMQLDAQRRIDKRYSKEVLAEMRAAAERMDTLGWPNATLERVVVARKFSLHEHWTRIRLVQLRGLPFEGDLSKGLEDGSGTPLWLGEDFRPYVVNSALYRPFPMPHAAPFMPYTGRHFDHAASLILTLHEIGIRPSMIDTTTSHP